MRVKCSLAVKLQTVALYRGLCPFAPNVCRACSEGEHLVMTSWSRGTPRRCSRCRGHGGL